MHYRKNESKKRKKLCTGFGSKLGEKKKKTSSATIRKKQKENLEPHKNKKNTHKINKDNTQVKITSWNVNGLRIKSRRRRILEKETQRFIGLFGFWRQHIPHLSQILAPLYRVTQKKNVFEWGETQQTAFKLAKEAIQHALDLWPVRDGDVDLNVTEVCGKELWKEVWYMLPQSTVTVYHVDAHCSIDSLDRWFNLIADVNAKISEAEVDTQNSDLVGLARWAHQKCGNFGVQITSRWAADRGIHLPHDMVKTVILQCPICQHSRH
ncbi:uncharacterized protein LOC144752358 [Lissotriton helveticus]